MCIFRESGLLYSFPQIRQFIFSSPKWTVFMCLWRTFGAENFLPQVPHSKSFICLWTDLMWIFRLCLLNKVCWQYTHLTLCLAGLTSWLDFLTLKFSETILWTFFKWLPMLFFLISAWQCSHLIIAFTPLKVNCFPWICRLCNASNLRLLNSWPQSWNFKIKY